jgi:hypothetical protein
MSGSTSVTLSEQCHLSNSLQENEVRCYKPYYREWFREPVRYSADDPASDRRPFNSGKAELKVSVIVILKVIELIQPLLT